MNVHPAFYRHSRYEQNIKTKFQPTEIDFARKMGIGLTMSQTEDEMVRCMNTLIRNNTVVQEPAETYTIQQTFCRGIKDNHSSDPNLLICTIHNFGNLSNLTLRNSIITEQVIAELVQYMLGELHLFNCIERFSMEKLTY